MSLKQKTILVVDDEDMLKLLNKVLSAAGFNVLIASNPEAGRKILSTEAPHVILSDLHIKPENGFSFIQSIRSQKQFKSIPILVLSAIALGVSDHVIKLLQAPMLLRKLRKALLNKDFVKWDVPAGEEPVVEISLEASVSAIGLLNLILSLLLLMKMNSLLRVNITSVRARSSLKEMHSLKNFLKPTLRSLW